VAGAAGLPGANAMPMFQYEAMDASGKEVKAELDAADSTEAVSKIRALGYFPTKVKEKGGRKRTAKAAEPGKKRKSSTPFSIGRVSTKQLTQFSRQLSTLQDAGLPILRSLRILEQQQKAGLLKSIIRQVADDVEGGATLSEAMGRHPKAFDRLFTNMVQAGEAGGVLEVILQRLADFMEKGQRLKKKVIGAMIYPIAVLSFAGGIVFMLMWLVVPKFKEIFKDFGTELPGITEVLLSISDWLILGYGWAMILAAPIVFMILLKILKQFAAGRYAMDWATLHIPVLGQIVSKSSIARMTRTLGTLISAGVPILEAINITRDTTGNEIYARAMGRVHDSIREGDTFANPLRASKVCDAIVVNMIDVGEETGDLDKMLLKIADNYDEEVDVLVGSLVSLLEPLMVILLGTIVGFIVLALFMPLVKLISAVMDQK
jgi:type IV pilus assembly protein PilC